MDKLALQRRDGRVAAAKSETADPEKDPSATRYDEISFQEVYDKGLNVMDMTAITLCQENKLPIIVFDMNKDGNLSKIVDGENVGTLVDL